jgi:hypothetical protein
MAAGWRERKEVAMAKGQVRSTKEKRKPKADKKKGDLPKYMQSSGVVSSAIGQTQPGQKK